MLRPPNRVAVLQAIQRAEAAAKKAKERFMRAMGTPIEGVAALNLERAQLNLQLLKTRLKRLEEEARIQEWIRRLDQQLGGRR